MRAIQGPTFDRVRRHLPEAVTVQLDAWAEALPAPAAEGADQGATPQPEEPPRAADVDSDVRMEEPPAAPAGEASEEPSGPAAQASDIDEVYTALGAQQGPGAQPPVPQEGL